MLQTIRKRLKAMAQPGDAPRHGFLGKGVLALAGALALLLAQAPAQQEKPKLTLNPVQGPPATAVPGQGPLANAHPRDEPFPGTPPGIRHVTPHRTALVLSGGGAKGAFQVGVLKYLYETRHINPKIITGTSVGSLNAAKLAEGPQAFAEVEKLWLGIQGNHSIYGWNPQVSELIRRIEADLEHFEDSLERTVLYGLGDPLGRVIGGIIEIYSTKPVPGDWVREINRIENFMIQSGLYKLLDDHLNMEAIARSGIRLRVATVTRDTGKLRYVNELGDLETSGGSVLREGIFRRAADGTVSRNDQGQVSIRDGVIASSAIPLVFEPGRIGGVAYWDGAIREDVPVRKALELGATNLIIVLCSPRAYKPTPLASGPSALQLALITYAMRTMDIMADQVMRDDLNTTLKTLDLLHEMGWNAVRDGLSNVRSFPLPRDHTGRVFTIPRYTVIEPPLVFGETTEFNPEFIKLNLQLGELVAPFAFLEQPDEAKKARLVVDFLKNLINTYRARAERVYERTRNVPRPGSERYNYAQWHATVAQLHQATRDEAMAKYFEQKLEEYQAAEPLAR